MNVTISGKGIDVGESFRTHAETKLTDGVKKYLDRVVSVDVVIHKENNMFHVSINGNTGTSSGLIIKSTAHAPDIYAALDSAAEKIEKQLRRYKRKLTDHHSQKVDEFSGVKYVISSTDKEEESAEQPLIIAEKATKIATLTVSEAVMRMNLAELPALMFYNAGNGRLNVVYKRADGNISWVDPQTDAKSKVA